MVFCVCDVLLLSLPPTFGLYLALLLLGLTGLMHALSMPIRSGPAGKIGVPPLSLRIPPQGSELLISYGGSIRV